MFSTTQQFQCCGILSKPTKTNTRRATQMGKNLHLSGAQESSGFDAVPAGWYRATVFEVSMKETKGSEGAKLPAGTAMINVKFQISEGEHENRRMFRSYVIAPAKMKDKE